jgi:hypothetical protein
MLRSDVSVPESGHVQRVNCFDDLFEDFHGLFFIDNFVLEEAVESYIVGVGDEDKSFGNRVGVFDFEEVLGEHLVTEVAEHGLVVLSRLKNVELDEFLLKEKLGVELVLLLISDPVDGAESVLLDGLALGLEFFVLV